MKQRDPLLSFEFATSEGTIKPLTFKNPIKIYKADKISDVLPSLELVQAEIQNGFYAAGFLSYESAPAFDPAFKVRTGGTMPLLWFGIFTEPLEESISSTGAYHLSEWIPSIDRLQFDSAIQSIKHSIEKGDTYQTNYTLRMNSQFGGDEIAYFETLKRAQSSNYCAYVQTGEHSIISASPELFFRLEGTELTTRPMKGTIKRGNSLAEDQENASWLYHSEKDRAENVMIVDLLRNDLGIIAETGSVRVDKLFEIEQYPTVHQMTSTIKAKVPETTQLSDIFKALFPCGSITGAPKISTMEIIADIETMPREVYCGAIGYMTPNKEAVFNVPIRTVLIEHETGKATYGVGGGVTWDSTSEGEYHEVLAKASLLKATNLKFQLLESLLLNEGHYFLLDEHLQRLENTANYFGYPFSREKIERQLKKLACSTPNDKVKVRLLIALDGKITFDTQLLSPLEESPTIILADEPIDKNNPFLYHKTTNREIYSFFQSKKPSGVFDVLLWNKEGELTEFTNGNVVLEMDDGKWTPPIDSGLLAGTYRERLIKNGDIQERTITRADLYKSKRIWFINSVRKWIEVKLT
ncbi:aminodeoxychorismate synthase component I [Mesobacillus maritimus]|uniref:Aminodeoxychorismate synthase component I n=1 Tax=Mesobacillus maritimus TaxID=1643336 RepID=A0ABS7K8N5_9BACI|nr:aminodeoxychorismate synthase component I [Mesobacillus maritimus]MBY0098628.1 aminodeoxychorismate synthase component I [Mesobacillus maritimus]